MPWRSDLSINTGGRSDYATQWSGFDPSQNTHYTWVPEAAASPQQAAPQPQATPVTPTFDPKIEANALYGKAMALYTGGYARMGASPAPIVGPFINGSTVDFIVSFGVPSNPEGDRKIYKIYLDNELAWSSTSGGTLPAHGTFAAEAFDFIFKPGTLTQGAVSLETEKYSGDENAYRPQMILQLRNLPWARFFANTGKPVPYIACDIGDVSDGANPLDFINLGEALERIARCPWANYSSSSPGGFETVGVTDIVDAILIKDNFTVIQLCQNVTSEYRNLDLVLSDMVRVKDRGANVTPDFVFDRDSIIGDNKAVSVIRGSATEQRREHELIAIDPDQDYTAVPSLSKIPRDPMIISAAVGKQTTTIPLVIDASTRQALATFSQQYQENARRRVTFKVGAAGYEIEPGDLFALTDIADGFDNEVFKCTQTTHGANWIVDVEGEAILKCSIYSTPTPPIVIYRGHAESTSDLTTYTFAAQPIGDAAADRRVHVGVGGSQSIRTISSVTIGGVTATQNIQHSGDQASTAAIYTANVPTGTTADVVVVWSGGQQRCGIGIWSSTGLTSDAAIDADTGINGTGDFHTDLDIDVSTRDGGYIIVYGVHHNTTPSGPLPYLPAAITDKFFVSVEGGFAHYGASGTTDNTIFDVRIGPTGTTNGNSPVVAASF